MMHITLKNIGSLLFGFAFTQLWMSEEQLFAILLAAAYIPYLWFVPDR